MNNLNNDDNWKPKKCENHNFIFFKHLPELIKMNYTCSMAEIKEIPIKVCLVFMLFFVWELNQLNSSIALKVTFNL